MAECLVCKLLLKTCEELGDREFCAGLIEDLKKSKISEEEVINKITAKFGDKFKETLDKNIT